MTRANIAMPAVTSTTAQPSPSAEIPFEGNAAPSPTQVGLCRRLNRALHDLSLLTITGPNWVAPTGNEIGFGQLSISVADRLVQEFEDLAAGRTPTSSGSGPGQLSLF